MFLGKKRWSKSVLFFLMKEIDLDFIGMVAVLLNFSESKLKHSLVLGALLNYFTVFL